MDTRVGWIISGDDAIVARLESLAESFDGHLLRVMPAELDAGELLAASRSTPRLVLLDIGGDLDWGVAALRALRRSRLRAPVIVLSDDFSRAFGRKIVSQGVQYYLNRQFCAEEAQTLLGSFFTMDQTAP